MRLACVGHFFKRTLSFGLTLKSLTAIFISASPPPTRASVQEPLGTAAPTFHIDSIVADTRDAESPAANRPSQSAYPKRDGRAARSAPTQAAVVPAHSAYRFSLRLLGRTR